MKKMTLTVEIRPPQSVTRAALHCLYLMLLIGWGMSLKFRLSIYEVKCFFFTGCGKVLTRPFLYLLSCKLLFLFFCQ